MEDHAEAVQTKEQGEVCVCVGDRVGVSWLQADSDSLCFLSDQPWINLRLRPHLGMDLQHESKRKCTQFLTNTSDQAFRRRGSQTLKVVNVIIAEACL